MNISGRDFLLEVGTEEIPSGYIQSISAELKENFVKMAKDQRLKYADIKPFSTPRRLAIIVNGLAERQETVVIETVGPAERVAFDEAKKPTHAAIGFAKSQGVNLEDLKIKETERGRYVVAIKEIHGERTEKILERLVPELLQSLHFPKSMRWGSNQFRFIRPIQWIVALYGNKVLRCEVAGLKSGKVTYGHRFMYPNSINIKQPSEYVNKLRSVYCIVDVNERKEFLKKQLQQISRRLKLKINYSDELFSTVIDLVEYPVPVVCALPEKYMALPEKVLCNVLNEQQKFFTTSDSNGRIASKFIAVSNTKPRTQKVLRSGYERVVSARLADADFFFREDLRVPLSERVEKLKQMLFFEKLGTYYDKTMRLKEIVRDLSEKIAPDLTEKVIRAAHLCKADLVTHMVTEFPKLQGIMGMEYAKRNNEDEGVATAIYEHYLPTYAGDELPKTMPGIILGLADKMDNIVSGFILGNVPTGTADPYAYRRQALGIINTLLSSKLDLSISELSDIVMKYIKNKINFDSNSVKNAIIEFFRARINGLFTGGDSPKEIVDAVINDDLLNVVDMRRRIVALDTVSKDEQFNSLLLCYKRITNILGKHNFIEINKSQFIEKEELRLFEVLKNIESAYDEKLNKLEYVDALRELYLLIEPINNFFDKVLIMSEDINLKQNRLALLNNLKSLFKRFADFSKLPVKNSEV
jgi:glycyl-tRNA synthetase beta chain